MILERQTHVGRRPRRRRLSSPACGWSLRSVYDTLAQRVIDRRIVENDRHEHRREACDQHRQQHGNVAGHFDDQRDAARCRLGIGRAPDWQVGQGCGSQIPQPADPNTPIGAAFQRAVVADVSWRPPDGEGTGCLDRPAPYPAWRGWWGPGAARSRRIIAWGAPCVPAKNVPVPGINATLTMP